MGEAVIRAFPGGFRLSPEILIRAYAAGLFPMAESRMDRSVFWVDPDIRGILPLDGFHVPRSLRKTVRRRVFEIRYDTAFAEVIRGCAEPAPDHDRDDTWINDEIANTFIELHRMGFVHSVETWKDGRLVGGLYGMALGGAFFGESMFSRETDASKVALVHLVARLRQGGFVLLDTQFVTEHLKQFGAIEIPARDYLRQLDAALRVRAVFRPYLGSSEVDASLDAVFRQSSTHTS